MLYSIIPRYRGQQIYYTTPSINLYHSPLTPEASPNRVARRGTQPGRRTLVAS